MNGFENERDCDCDNKTSRLRQSCVSKSVISAQLMSIQAMVSSFRKFCSGNLIASLGSAFVRNDAKVFRFCTSKYGLPSPFSF